MFESSDILASVSICVDEGRTADCEEEGKGLQFEGGRKRLWTWYWAVVCVKNNSGIGCGGDIPGNVSTGRH